MRPIFMSAGRKAPFFEKHMLKKFWRKVAGKAAAGSVKHTIPYAEHGLTADDISFAAEKTVSRLQQAGYEAYVVGGAVRDLLIGAQPKDFDVATDATPEEVRALFRRSRIIGRRFRIVHVQVGPETIEVTPSGATAARCRTSRGAS